jgi:hypothetical protein
VRGGRHHLLHFRDGDLVVDPDAPVRPECHISAQPVAPVRVLYGRSSQWAEIARGGLLAWGPQALAGVRPEAPVQEPVVTAVARRPDRVRDCGA